MRKIVMFASMLALAVAAVAPLAVAQDDAAKGVAVTLKGINYNLVEALAKGTTATAEVNALKVSEATGADGAAIDALKGKTVHYLATEAGKDNANKTVTVKGTLFADANAILVESFEAEGGDEWDELDVNSLSGQQVL
jgi:hypothetical protein